MTGNGKTYTKDFSFNRKKKLLETKIETILIIVYTDDCSV